MFTLRTSLSLCCQLHQTRHLSRSLRQLDRFSRDSLRSRLHRQELKEIVKQPHSDAIVLKDSIPVRPISHLLRATGFTLLVGGVTFTVASIVDWERLQQLQQTHLQTARELINRHFSGKEPERVFSDGEKVVAYLILANVLVTLVWRIKQAQPFMWRYFSNSFASKSLCAPMLLSVFSHSSFVHLGLNMYVLFSFTQLSVDKFLGLEQFLAFYLTAGVVSSLTSIIHKAIIRNPIRALGASGAILGLLTYTCCKIPHARFTIFFFPFFDFSAENAVIGLILFDLAGLVFGFKLFDHAAHLGGALFGVAYALWGEELLWNDFRLWVQRHWSELAK